MCISDHLRFSNHVPNTQDQLPQKPVPSVEDDDIQIIPETQESAVCTCC